MKNRLFLKIIVFLFLQFNSTFFYAQMGTGLKQYYTWYDAIVGTGNSGLYNGIVYTEKYETENDNHKYFSDNKYVTGNIIYDGQPYFDVSLKYDIYEDEVIVKLPNTVGHLFVKLIKEKINEFSIDGRRFVNTVSIKNNTTNERPSFHEVLYETSGISLLKKYHKAKTEYLSDARKYSKFSIKNYIVILYESEYYRIDSKKDLTQLFPELKKSISMFYRKEKGLLNSNEVAFFTMLIKNNIVTSLTNTDPK